jgi:hypothetical protein
MKEKKSTKRDQTKRERENCGLFIYTAQQHNGKKGSILYRKGAERIVSWWSAVCCCGKNGGRMWQHHLVSFLSSLSIPLVSIKRDKASRRF